MQQTNLSGSYFFYSCYLLCILRQIAITHNSHFGPRLQSTITRACAQASKQASKQTSKQANMLSIWFSTLLSFGPHLWFCLSQWCHVLRDCGTILQGASKHITTMPWRVIQYQHCERALIWTYRILHRTSECQAGLYIDHKGVDSMCSCKLACSIKNISKSQTPAKYPVEVKRVLVKGHALLTQMCHSRWLRAPHWIDYVAFRCLRIPL